MENLNFKLNIINQDKYILYIFESKIDPISGATNQPTNKDIHMWKILTENFLENCKINNTKFGFIFNLHDVATLQISLIIDICTFFIKHNSFLKKNLIANCFIMENNQLPGFINLFLKYYKPAKPIKFLNNINECKKYIQESLICDKHSFNN